MILRAYSIRDTKSEVYNVPFYKNTHGEAERAFREIANDEKTSVCKYPEDFDLYYIGEYDDQTGKFHALDTPQHQIKAVEVKQRVN